MAEMYPNPYTRQAIAEGAATAAFFGNNFPTLAEIRAEEAADLAKFVEDEIDMALDDTSGEAR